MPRRNKRSTERYTYNRIDNFVMIYWIKEERESLGNARTNKEKGK